MGARRPGTSRRSGWRCWSAGTLRLSLLGWKRKDHQPHSWKHHVTYPFSDRDKNETLAFTPLSLPPTSLPPPPRSASGRMSTFSPARSQSSPDIASGALSASSSSSPAQLRSFNDIFMTPSSIQDSHRTRSSTLSNPSRTTSATPDPIRALQRTGSTQFFMFPGSPSPSTHPGTHGSPLHSRLERLWSSPYGTTSTGWSSATSFELLDMAEGGGFPHPPGMEHRRFGHEVSSFPRIFF